MQILKPLRAALVQIIDGQIDVQRLAPGATIILLDEVAPPAAEVVQAAPKPAPVVAPPETNARKTETNAPIRESRIANLEPKPAKADTKVQPNTAKVQPNAATFNGKPTIRQQLLQVLTVDPQTTTQICKLVPSIVSKRVGIELANMAAKGKITRRGFGMYSLNPGLPPPAETVPAAAPEPAPVPETELEDAEAAELDSLLDIPQIVPGKARVVTFGDKV